MAADTFDDAAQQPANNSVLQRPKQPCGGPGVGCPGCAELPFEDGIVALKA